MKALLRLSLAILTVAQFSAIAGAAAQISGPPSPVASSSSSDTPPPTTSVSTVPPSASTSATPTSGGQIAQERPSLPPPSVNAPPAPAIANAYQVNAGDQLEIYVWGEERLQRVVSVLPDGTMSFPLVGQIVAQGRRLSELEQLISSRLASQYRGQVPQVTVSVKAPTGMQFSVMGRVKAPGAFTPTRTVNVLEALSMAGGPEEFANLDNVLIIRKTGGAVTTLRLRLGKIFRSGTAGGVDSPDIKTIQPGDTVIVP